VAHDPVRHHLLAGQEGRRVFTAAGQGRFQPTNRSSTSPPTHHAGCAPPHQGALGPGAAAAEARQVPVVFGRSVRAPEQAIEHADRPKARRRGCCRGVHGDWASEACSLSMPSQKSLRLFFREQDGESVGCLFYAKFSKLEYITKNGVF
jgi:hypothetical protein